MRSACIIIGCAYTEVVRVEIADYDPDWPHLFHARANRIRVTLQDVALRIDHIGSTSVPGLAAKPIIDIQISVATFEPLDAFRRPLEGLGYIFRDANTDRTKRYFREAPCERREHVHVRRAGSWGEQFALLFRDYLRAHPEEAVQYAQTKRQLARLHRDDGHGYTDAKGPYIWDIIRRANDWSQDVGWEPGPSDA